MTGTSDPLNISVVICTYNRDKFIGTVLLCLAAQTFPRDRYELIIVDNNSTDRTAEISNNFIKNYPEIQASYVLEMNRGLSFARNRGIDEARAPIITFLDDDAEPVPGYLEEIAAFFTSHRVAAGAGGKVIPKYPDGKEPAWMNKFLAGSVGLTDHGETVRRFHAGMKYPTGCNMSYKADVLKKAGGFNNQLTFRSDDKHIFHEVSKISTEIYYLPKALVYHNIDEERLEFASFKKLFLKTGNEEKIRVRTEKGNLAVLEKFLEYTFKLAASIALYLFFLVKGQEIKGRYIVASQWYTLSGFLRENVFVR